MGGIRLPPAGLLREIASRTIGAKLVGDQALFRTAGPKQNRAGTVAEKGVAFLVSGVDHSAIAIATDDQCALAVARGHELRPDQQTEKTKPAQAA